MTINRDEAMANPVMRAAILADEARRAGKAPPVTVAATSPRAAPKGKRKRPPCDLGHPHANKWEATVCESTRRGLAEGEWCISGARLFLPGMSRGGEACYFTPDFTVWRAGRNGRPELVRCYDAKAGRGPKGKRSPEWRRGRMAFAAEYGVEVVEVSPAGDGGAK